MASFAKFHEVTSDAEVSMKHEEIWAAKFIRYLSLLAIVVHGMTEIFCLCQRNRFRLCLLVLVVIAQNVTAMRIVLQRVKSASVSVNQATISSIGRGVRVLAMFAISYYMCWFY